jgi:hypothetical protein
VADLNALAAELRAEAVSARKRARDTERRKVMLREEGYAAGLDAAADRLAAALNAAPGADLDRSLSVVECANCECQYDSVLAECPECDIGTDGNLCGYNPAPPAADGMVVVPREPTEAMLEAAVRHQYGDDADISGALNADYLLESLAATYCAMLAAAPRQDGAEGVG